MSLRGAGWGDSAGRIRGSRAVGEGWQGTGWGRGPPGPSPGPPPPGLRSWPPDPEKPEMERAG